VAKRASERKKRKIHPSALIRTKGDFELKLGLNGKKRRTRACVHAVMERGENGNRNSNPEAGLL
jgi:hypothetical protein